MSRASFLGLLVFTLVVAAFATLRGSQLALAIPILLYWAFALWWTPDQIALEVNRTLSADRVTPDTAVSVAVAVLNVGGRLEELTLEDALPPGLRTIEGSNRHLVSLAPRQTFEFEYTVQGSRGGYAFEILRAEASDDFGLFRRGMELRLPMSLHVLPTIVRVKAVPIRPRRTRVYAGTIPARVGGAGVEFFGVRPYGAGDSARRINWRASARHLEDVYANDFEQERVADVAVVLDGRERSNLRAGEHSLFEYSVVAAGSLANALLSQGNRVGLLVYSQYIQWTLPGYGKIQRERILHALAVAAPGASQIFEGMQYLPARLFPPESQIAIVSPLIQDDVSTLVQLRARGYNVMAVCPDPVGFEATHLSNQTAKYSIADVRLAARIIRLERAAMLGRLRRAGVQVIEWDVSKPFDLEMRGAFRRLGG
jgi:uncharacterized protein (DUF58 family)